MTTMIRYQPWTMHRALLDDINRFFDQSAGNDASSGATADWSPAVDIEEYADRFVLHADVPGVEPSSIEVTLEKGVLTLGGSRAEAVQAEGVERRRVERTNGRFHRRFSLPDTVDSEAVTAKNSNGVLEIVIPKRAAAQPRRITVNH
ncbi:MAG: Hsp20/alpha crystallin family protein [Nevskia sp.]